jgi:hypothetical protein
VRLSWHFRQSKRINKTIDNSIENLASTHRCLTSDDEAFVVENIRRISCLGYPPNLRDAKRFITAMMQQDAPTDRSVPSPTDITVQRLIERATNLSSVTKASAIDRARMLENDESRIDAFRLKCEQTVAMIKSLLMVELKDGKWDCFANIPSD